MSLRRVQGRFTTTSASEAFNRQLTTPVNKWRKQWVMPDGIQPESSYKVYRWVKVNERVSLEDGAEDMTPEVEEDEDEAEEDGGAEDGEDGEDGEGAELAEDAGKEVERGEAEVETGAVDAPLSGPPADSLPTEGAIEVDAAGPVAPQSPPAKQSPHAPPSPPPATDPPAELGIPVDIPPPPERPHTELPSNAIELTNTAPGHTEEGTGDLGTNEGGMEIVRPEMGGTIESEGVSVTDGGMGVGGTEEGMVVDLPVQEGGEALVLEERDPGLVMGEMEAPDPGLRVLGEEKQPPEVENA